MIHKDKILFKIRIIIINSKFKIKIKTFRLIIYKIILI